MASLAIKQANLRDLSYIAANLRPEDHAEIFCQVPPGTKPSAIARSSLATGEARVVFRNDRPRGAFGFVPVSEGVLSAWAYGMPGFERCIPAVTRHVYREFVGHWLRHDIRRIEARTIEHHTSAHRWLEKAGAVRCCSLEQWGRNGERFYLYEWVRGRVSEQTCRRWGHVL